MKTESHRDVRFEGSDIEAILRDLDVFDFTYKRDAVDAAIRLKAEITPRLLAVLEDAIKNPVSYLPPCKEHDQSQVPGRRDYSTWSHIYAVFLLAQFREPKAHQLIADLFSLPRDLVDGLFGDSITEDLPNLLHDTFSGSPDAIKSIVLNKAADDYARTSAADALALLVADGLLDRTETLNFLSNLFKGTEAESGSDFWGFLASTILDLYPAEHINTIRQAYANGLISNHIVTLKHFERANQNSSAEQCLEELRRKIKRRRGKSIHDELGNWYCFKEKDGDDLASSFRSPATIIHAEPKVGRNDPCPCGSGKKFKKCCLQ